MVNAHTRGWVTAAALLALGCSPMMDGMMEGSPADAGARDAWPPGTDGARPMVDVGVRDAEPVDAEPVDAVAPAPREGLRINQVQMRATVNSYHASLVPGVVDEFSYDHLRLAEQAEQQGVRVFDLDVRGDRVSFMAISPATDEHVVDRWNNCSERMNPPGGLIACLWNLREWLEANPEHPLVIILVGESELLERRSQMMHQLGELESQLAIGLDRERLLTPGDVRGAHPTLWHALQAGGWPTVEATRGKVMLVLNDRGVVRARYLLTGGDDPENRLLFIIGDPELEGDPALRDEVVFTFEPPVVRQFESDMARLPRMRALVDAGYLVHAITDDAERARRLRAEGVHFVGTRFPDEVFGPLDGSPTTCNPITAPADCRADQIEPP